MKNLKEYITEAAKSDIVMSPDVLKQFLSISSTFDNTQLMDILEKWYSSYAHVMVTKCKSGAIKTPFDIRINFSSKDGIIFKGINKKTVEEFLYQLDARFDSMEYDPNFSHLSFRLTREGLMLMFKNNTLSSEVQKFCDKNNL